LKNVAFVIDHFRIMNVDQFDYLADQYHGKYKVFGFEIFSKHSDYPFERRSGQIFDDATLIDDSKRTSINFIQIALKILSEARRKKITDIFLCHYERPSIFLAAVLLRILGVNVFVLQDSKFDDKTRSVLKEAFKWLLYTPYKGGLVASARSADYVKFLGVPGSKVEVGYYTISAARMRSEGFGDLSASQIDFETRPFVCVARLVEKKNHSTLLEAFSLYVQRTPSPRVLELYGDGELRDDILKQVKSLGLEQHVVFCGNVGAKAVAEGLARSLCLLLPSTVEQFGIVVIEALTLGIPVIVSDRVGARDDYVRTAVNGFVVEAHNPEGWAHYMAELSSSKDTWERMSEAALANASTGDIARFAQAVDRLLG
jgi:L-malate glycosyltransferase